ncbi:hypothetical protein THRCLA_03555 [Thraustotheca clavata]|uniref:Uncharacterized protein n=1 Tax=Thraustotheca clavata TaxID=74557 RepID=A0A1W0A1N7_9STRA|nr:hypothetical protein THRCLA_03555 [Thraustotheca clavata]
MNDGKRKAVAKGGPPKKPKIKNPLPLHPTDVIPDVTDLTQHKCSYHDCHNRAKVVQTFGIFCNRHAVVFPCGFPGCREKAPTNGTRCAKHADEGNKLLDEALSVRSQSIPVCRTKGCFKNDQGRGYCRGHEKLMMATGQLPHAINKRRLNSAYTMCCYPNCNKHSQRNHLCRIHGNELIKQAQAIAEENSMESYEQVLARLQKELRRCTHPGCEKNAQRDRLCTTHFHIRGQAEKGLQKSDLDSSKDKIVKFCSDDKCTQPVYCNWLCKQHYEQKEKKGKHHQPVATPMTGPKAPLKKKPGLLGKKPSSGLEGDLFELTPPMAGQASMVELLYPGKDGQVTQVNSNSATSNTTATDMANLQLEESSFQKKDEYRVEKPQYHNTFVRPTFAQPSRYTTMGYDYISPHNQPHQPQFSMPQDQGNYHHGYHPSLPPPNRLCTNAGCNRPMTNGKGLCDICVSVLTQVQAFSPTIQQFGQQPHHQSFENEPNNNSTNKPYWSQQYNFYNQHPMDKPDYYKQQPLPQKHGCRFRGCGQPTKPDSVVCHEHCQATFCASPDCEEILPSPGVCGLHAIHNQCCYDGCHQNRYSPTALACVDHGIADHCSHHQCFKFAAKPNSVCSFHLKNLSSCKLCHLYDVPCSIPPPSASNENASLNNTMPLLSGHKMSF